MVKWYIQYFPLISGDDFMKPHLGSPFTDHYNHISRQPEHIQIITLRALISTAVDILCFYYPLCNTPDNQLLKVKYAFNLEKLIYGRLA